MLLLHYHIKTESLRREAPVIASLVAFAVRQFSFVMASHTFPLDWFSAYGAS